MGFSTVFASIAFIFIFLAGVMYVASFQRSMALTAHAAHEQSERTQELAAQTIALSVAEYLGVTTTTWIDDLYSEFLQGDTSGGSSVLGEGSVEIDSAPYSSSTFDSQIFDSGYAASNYTTITWTSVEPALTDVAFQARSGATTAAVQGASWSGPDGTAGTYYTVSGGSLNSTLSSNRYFQYRAFLNTGDNGQTPTLQAVEIGVRRPVGVIALNITNTGGMKLDPTTTDVYVGAVRIERNDTVRTLHLHDVSGQALWDPGELLSITVYQTLTGATQVTVANDAARASSVVN